MKRFLIRHRILQRFLTSLLTMALLIGSLPAGLPQFNHVEEVQAATNVQLSNPRVIESEYWQLPNDTTWDCVWFGTYPQTEITSADGDIYTKLCNAEESEWENNDITIDGVNYRRMNGYQTLDTYTQKYEDLYHWTDSLDTYHYFRYEPIKWFVLQVEEDKAFLLAERALDTQLYTWFHSGPPFPKVVWETCDLRKWLNGYEGGNDFYNVDYTQDNFINRAFDKEEQTAILLTDVVNEDNPEYGTDAGNDTKDKIYLLSQQEVQDKKYGFDDTLLNLDAARQVIYVTDYAIQRGAAIKSISDDGKNLVTIPGSKWWLRTPGNEEWRVEGVTAWGMVREDYSPMQTGYGIRPCLYLDLTQTSLYAYAGTVRRNGEQKDSIVNEVAAPNLWTKKDVTIQQLPAASAITYGQTLADSSLSGGKVIADGKVIEGSWRFKDISISPTVGDSNSTEYEVIFYPNDWKRYNRTTGKVKLTVNKALYPSDYPHAEDASMDTPVMLYESYSDNKTVGDISLEAYPGWEWTEESKNIPFAVSTKENPLIATAEYLGADKDNFSQLAAEIQIVVTECVHRNCTITATSDATCMVFGSKTYTCSDCGVFYRVADMEKPRVECVYEFNEQKSIAGDCTTDKVTVTICKWCKKEKKVIEKCKGHIFGPSDYTEPTCYEDGLFRRSCKNCSYVWENEIPAINHIYKVEISTYKGATCTKTGYAKSICSICNHTMTETIEAMGHDCDVDVTEATCTTDGNKVESCTREGCGHVVTTKLPALGHTIGGSWEEKRATCTEDGLHIDFCVTCQNRLQTVIQAKGHTYKETLYPASTKEDGFILNRCSNNCGALERSYIDRIASIELSESKYIYDGNIKEPSVTVKDSKGNSLKKDVDYTVSYSSGRQNAGTYTVTLTFKGNYTGTEEKTFTIEKQSISDASVKLSTEQYTYNGKAKTPSVTVMDDKGNKLKKNTDYTLLYSSGRKKVGTYTVTVKMQGNYKGTIKKTFSIIPKSTRVSKLTAQKKGFKVTWKKQTAEVTGYQIQYSTSSKFTKKTTKTLTVKNNKTTSHKISKLKAKKKYYVRVRTYKTVKVNGKSTKVYSDWSKAKSIKTK